MAFGKVGKWLAGAAEDVWETGERLIREVSEEGLSHLDDAALDVLEGLRHGAHDLVTVIEDIGEWAQIDELVALARRNPEIADALDKFGEAFKEAPLVAPAIMILPYAPLVGVLAGSYDIRRSQGINPNDAAWGAIGDVAAYTTMAIGLAAGAAGAGGGAAVGKPLRDVIAKAGSWAETQARVESGEATPEEAKAAARELAGALAGAAATQASISVLEDKIHRMLEAGKSIEEIKRELEKQAAAAMAAVEQEGGADMQRLAAVAEGDYDKARSKISRILNAEKMVGGQGSVGGEPNLVTVVPVARGEGRHSNPAERRQTTFGGRESDSERKAGTKGTF